MKRLVLAVALLAWGTPAGGQERSLAIEKFDAAIRVEADGTVDVAETITARFIGQWNGIYRTIPVRYRTPQGFNWTLQLNFLGATGADGNALKVESERAGNSMKFKIWVPEARDVVRTITLHYQAKNGLRFFDEHDELYWNVTGDEWDVPIQAASARIELPPAARGIRAIAFNGVYGATARDAQVTVDGASVRLTMPKALGFHEGLTAVVGWNKGAVPEPSRAERAMDVATSNWPLMVPFIVFIGMFLIWRRTGRDPASLPVSVQYEPPGGLTPAEAGTLMDGSADMRDITATLVDLAVRGHLKIEEREDSRLLGLLKRRDYVFHRLKPEGASPLATHETRVLDGIFADGDEQVRLSELENEFYTRLPEIRSDIFDELIRRRLYLARPDRVKSHWFVGAVVLGIALGFLGLKVGVDRFNLSPPAVVLSAIVSGLIVALFARVMPARTVAGARTLERVRGFEEFLRRVEGDRYKEVVKTPEMFERFLPYAMVFRVERKWARAFEDIYREPPQWYVGANPMTFGPSNLTHRLSDLTTSANTTMSSSPRSSGGSGFSGGSSGGGSGGGGGGGF